MNDIVSQKRTLSVHQEHELLSRLEAAGLTGKDAQRVIEFKDNRLAKWLVQILRKGDISLKRMAEGSTQHIIECDTEPSALQEMRVVVHQECEKFEWDPTKVWLFWSGRQKTKHIAGSLLRKELEQKPVLNAYALDYLLEYQELIPAEWKDMCVFFWGTIYRLVGSHNELYVRYIAWREGGWVTDYRLAGVFFDESTPAAMFGPDRSCQQ